MGESGNKPPALVAREEPTKRGAGFKTSQPWNGCHAFKKPVIQQAKFEGKCAKLKGYIYDCSNSRQADIFTKMTKEIAEYVGRTYKYGNDTKLVVENLTMPIFTEPADPPSTPTKTQTRIWEKKVDEYVRKESYLEENLKTL